MDRATALISSIVEQDYPLSVTHEMASALVVCIGRIMDMVPEDDVVLVRGEYDLITSALCHPEGDLPRTNERVIRSPDPEQ